MGTTIKGGVYLVNGKPVNAEGTALKSFPSKFPGRKALLELGIATPAQLKNMTKEDLIAMKISDSQAESIIAAAAKLKDEPETDEETE